MRVSRRLGLRGHEKLVASYGAREIATGIGILAARDPTPWIWGRVAGDALDLGTLAGGLARGTAGSGQCRAGDRCRRRGHAAGRALRPGAERAAAAARKRPARDYGDRRGMPQPAEAMRGAARDFKAPRDFRIPDPLRPWTDTA